MPVEIYRFRYQGQEFEVQIDLDNGPTTTNAPNLHVIVGQWKTWHLDAGEHDGPLPRLYQSIDPNDPNAEHPAGNLSYADSNSNGGILCTDSDGTITGVVGRLYQRPIGSAAIWRMFKNAGT